MAPESTRLYQDRAELYDRIYDFKDYRAEAQKVHRALSDHGIPDGARVLDAGCGTGRHLAELSAWYHVAGFDANGGILEVARQRLPSVQLFEARLEDFEVGEPFDAIVCLFGVIGYVLGLEALKAACAQLAKATGPGGVVLIEPWIDPVDFRDGHLSMMTHDSDELKLCRACVSRRENEVSVFDFHWLVLRKGSAAPEQFVERHELWLCPRQTMREVLEEAGFVVGWDPQGVMPGRGLWIATRR